MVDRLPQRQPDGLVSLPPAAVAAAAAVAALIPVAAEQAGQEAAVFAAAAATILLAAGGRSAAARSGRCTNRGRSAAARSGRSTRSGRTGNRCRSAAARSGGRTGRRGRSAAGRSRRRTAGWFLMAAARLAAAVAIPLEAIKQARVGAGGHTTDHERGRQGHPLHTEHLLVKSSRRVRHSAGRIVTVRPSWARSTPRTEREAKHCRSIRPTARPSGCRNGYGSTSVPRQSPTCRSCGF